MGSRYLAGEKWKTKRFQFVIKLDAMALAMVVEIVSEMAAANECNRLGCSPGVCPYKFAKIPRLTVGLRL